MTTHLGRYLLTNAVAAALLTSGAVLASGSGASAAFVGLYDASNWTLTNSNANGFVATSNAQNLISLVGGYNRSREAGTTDFTIAAAATGSVVFDYSYFTLDQRGPSFDRAGFLLNGVFTRLSNNFGSNTQGGSYSALVNVGDIFGFRVRTRDNRFGPAVFTVANFSAPSNAQPVPFELESTAGTVLLGFWGVWKLRNGKRKQLKYQEVAKEA